MIQRSRRNCPKPNSCFTHDSVIDRRHRPIRSCFLLSELPIKSLGGVLLHSPICCCKRDGAAVFGILFVVGFARLEGCKINGDCGASADIVKRSTQERKQDPRCPPKAEFKECTNLCPDKHCGNILEKSSCFSLRCGEPGCMCVEGHVRKSANFKEGCVRRETCLDEARKNKVQRRKRNHDSIIPGH
ncbi:hypothetical protein L596_003256 [Steinernema carpocapsae]|uniref:TIL domain-containing protein n=1 Tax=Steinernema carpocapsae TaxID=34508 RepID=A0A4U8US47_STECR|nr:hypothetical protein L596_003256 [Steinernema carpocapsae]